MKRTILLAGVLVLALEARAQTPPAPGPLASYSPTLTWCDYAGALGYKVYMGTAPRSYGTPVTIGNITTHQMGPLAPGNYFFSVSAIIDAAGHESGLSNEVSITVAPPPGPPEFSSISVPSILTTEATIAWTTIHECSGTLLWGTDPARLLAIKANNLETTDHLARLTGLLTRTHYVFRVESTCAGVTARSELRSFNTK